MTTKPASKPTATAPRRTAKTPRQTAKPRAAKSYTATTSPPKTIGPSGKLGVVVALMRRPEGATLVQMSEATGWQAHSVRGALAGSLKKKHGLTILSEPAEGGRVYRIPGDAPAAAAAAAPAAAAAAEPAA